MRFLFFFLLLFFFSNTTIAQEEHTVLSTVNKLFDAMRSGDSSAVANCFHPEARLMSVGERPNGAVKTPITSVKDFVNMVGSPHEEIYDEQIYDMEILQEGRLATVWAPYTFYVGEKLSHCGTNAFQLVKDAGGWRIIQIVDTRYRKNCKEPAHKLIHKLLDNWHLAAATADEETFFNSMTEDGIYLGTDDSERWLRDEMRTWSKPYFEKESAWAFTAKDRELYFAEDNHTAWFEERLVTWMGPCRGSGVLRLTPDGWKIAHYNLAVTIPNEKIDGFLKLIEKKKPNKK